MMIRKSPDYSMKRIGLLSREFLPTVKRFFAGLAATDESIFLADQVARRLREFLDSDEELTDQGRSAILRLFRGCQEIVIEHDHVYATLRPRMGHRLIVRLHSESEAFEPVDRQQYLRVKDALIQGVEEASKPGLTLDFSPFFEGFPRTHDANEIGEGISFLNRQLSGQMYEDPNAFRRAMLQFLRQRTSDGHSMLINEHIDSVDTLYGEIDEARQVLAESPSETPYQELAHTLRVHGFEPGWGNTAERIRESLALLGQILESPDARRMERLLARLPLVRTVLMVSPHGWFAQEKVLGRPDTGGQITYVLDQVRSLERELLRQFEEAGVEATPKIVILTRLIPNADETSCCIPRERVHGTNDCWIIRAPFRNPATGEIHPDWISRFHIWPYLEAFALESRSAIVNEMLGRPDLIIGHYSDGNLVAHLLAHEFGTTHCGIAHALEKTKYLMSDSYWADMERDYNFSLQFTADLLAYNSADFIVSSSYREIAGTESELGMFESYETFSMPGLYRVVSGVNPRLARHNIVPPGVSEECFFPQTEKSLRVEGVTSELIERFLQASPGANSFGTLKSPQLPPILAMARIDKIKNLSGLIALYGKHPELRKRSNLLIISSLIDEAGSSDQEEIEEIRKMHALIDQYKLSGHVRWCAAVLNRVETGEIYRVIADRHGVFAQPALMENFGLTVIESMACGCPIVATCYGGPREIVVPRVSGEVQDPNDHEAFADALLRIIMDGEYWDRLSRGGIERVKAAYSWETHARRLAELANVYSYWNYLDVMNRSALDQYIDTLYYTLYRPRCQAMLAKE